MMKNNTINILKELTGIFGIGLLLFVLSVYLHVFDPLISWGVQYPSYFNTLFILLIYIAASLPVFIYQRWKEQKAEIEELAVYERALRESEFRIRVATVGSMIGTWEYIPGNEYLLIVNSVFKKITGMTARGNTIPLEHILDRITRDDREELKRLFRNEEELKAPFFEREITFSLPDNSTKILLVKGSALQNDGEEGPVSIFGTIQDVTTTIQCRSAMERVNTKLRVLSRITRHDILNQITALQGDLDLLKEMNKSEELSLLLGHQEKIIDTITRQIVFTRDYQELGANPPEWQDVREVVQKSMAEFALSYLTFDLITQGIEIYADHLLEKVFSILFDNAVRHGLRTSSIRIFHEFRNSYAVISVQDNGIGLPGSKKSKIFERGTSSNPGYGLFLAREILSITDITLVETGIYDRGARFEIRVPKGNYRLKKVF